MKGRFTLVGSSEPPPPSCASCRSRRRAGACRAARIRSRIEGHRQLDRQRARGRQAARRAGNDAGSAGPRRPRAALPVQGGGRGAELLGLVVRPVPRRGADPRALAPQAEHAGRDRRRRRRARREGRRAEVHPRARAQLSAASRRRRLAPEALRRRRLPGDSGAGPARADRRDGARPGRRALLHRARRAAASGAHVKLVVLVLVALLVAPASALAAACPKASLTDIEDEVMCLQCGVPLNLSEDAPSAKQERAFIQSRVVRCESKQQIKDELVAQFGSRILAEPKSKSAWLIPVIAFAAGAVAVALGARRWRRRRVTPGGGPPPLDSGDSARLEADLERYDL